MSDTPRGVEHTDSIDSHDSAPKQPEKTKSRRPPNTAFRQQRLKAWQPILTPKTVLPLFFTIGIIFAPIGGLLLYASSQVLCPVHGLVLSYHGLTPLAQQVREIKLDYTHCINDAPDFTTFADMPGSAVESAFKNANSSVRAQWARKKDVNVTLHNGREIKGNQCVLQFTIPEDMGAPVLFYYQLTNFYQNHRRYAESCDLQQLKGDARSYSDITGSKCTPLYGIKPNDTGKPYYPCGLIANSMFNDSFSSPAWQNPPNDGKARTYNMTDKGIAWDSDKDLYGPTKYKASDIVPPPNWAIAYPDGYTTDGMYRPPDLQNWEAFQVWMRTAGLPTFSKLAMRNDQDTMVSGIYQITVDDHFPTIEYKGTKSILLTTRTVMGGRNNFLGIAYITVGGVCIILGAIFTATHLLKPRKLGDHTHLTWNKVPASKPSGPSTAMASGREIRPGDA
ncbi:LEM3/CDC50 family protein [Metarhizium guizhouense ARSEF 977]|uniref:LEM3/CDC50 family protein n=1 Tax=Metarhizium guizhouense (strain ARSEF 977) TaxID=1276136 RepID=A0A0B4HG59_METGA|nr:LEM3/CDC50 family protein [Metarhizium guizhouense ARSEF 977]